MCEIKINNNITEDPCDLYGPNGEYIGQIQNILSLYDVRCQIKENELTGYYIIFHNEKLEINKYGILNPWPDDLFGKLDNYLNFMISL